ncbi:DeoR/GlpR transcriptional regulator [Macrococcus hajekii]|uniref:DeoR/GlpR transcriptional regulator n=1 Tax=Macrococcus hajekii TaxID=198482 RepID=A0A4R6BIP7_9STAP|nr:DeoR/GlpR family DNA-binding transcription regulator [Macrococcus hajekii]TDM01525.1 DeoR/GlpR transcriptional regulator [Macrococcus hajekii]GGB00721.1 DeoR family transcriptional regulator [Macrococcus hajekii]
MLTIKRHEKIIELLDYHEIVSLQQLMEITGSSESTIRRDLSALEKAGKLIRVHGGATCSVHNKQDTNLAIKTTRFVHEKEVMAQQAAALIEDHDCLFLDAGSSTLSIIPYLNQQHLTVVTNGLTHVAPLIEKGIRVFMAGGYIKNNTLASIGAEAKKMISQFNFDKAFIGVNGVDLDKGFTTPDPEEAALKRIAIQQSTHCYFLADESKFGNVTFATISELKAGSIITHEQNVHLKKYKKFIKVG